MPAQTDDSQGGSGVVPTAPPSNPPRTNTSCAGSRAGKLCSRCRVVKPLDMFCRDPTKKIGYQSWCKSCYREHNEKRSQSVTRSVTESVCSICKVVKPAAAFIKDARRSTGLDARCKECRRPCSVLVRNGLLEPERLCSGCGEVKPSSEYKLHQLTQALAAAADAEANGSQVPPAAHALMCKACVKLRRLMRVKQPTVAEKCCLRCQQVKPAGDFIRDTRKKSGLGPRCKTCEQEYVREKREKKKQQQAEGWREEDGEEEEEEGPMATAGVTAVTGGFAWGEEDEEKGQPAGGWGTAEGAWLGMGLPGSSVEVKEEGQQRPRVPQLKRKHPSTGAADGVGPSSRYQQGGQLGGGGWEGANNALFSSAAQGAWARPGSSSSSPRHPAMPLDLGSELAALAADPQGLLPLAELAFAAHVWPVGDAAPAAAAWLPSLDPEHAADGQQPEQQPAGWGEEVLRLPRDGSFAGAGPSGQQGQQPQQRRGRGEGSSSRGRRKGGAAALRPDEAAAGSSDCAVPSFLGPAPLRPPCDWASATEASYPDHPRHHRHHHHQQTSSFADECLAALAMQGAYDAMETGEEVGTRRSSPEPSGPGRGHGGSGRGEHCHDSEFDSDCFDLSVAVAVVADGSGGAMGGLRGLLSDLSPLPQQPALLGGATLAAGALGGSGQQQPQGQQGGGPERHVDAEMVSAFWGFRSPPEQPQPQPGLSQVAGDAADAGAVGAGGQHWWWWDEQQGQAAGVCQGLPAMQEGTDEGEQAGDGGTAAAAIAPLKIERGLWEEMGSDGQAGRAEGQGEGRAGPKDEEEEEEQTVVGVQVGQEQQQQQQHRHRQQAGAVGLGPVSVEARECCVPSRAVSICSPDPGSAAGASVEQRRQVGPQAYGGAWQLPPPSSDLAEPYPAAPPITRDAGSIGPALPRPESVQEFSEFASMYLRTYDLEPAAGTLPSGATGCTPSPMGMQPLCLPLSGSLHELGLDLHAEAGMGVTGGFADLAQGGFVLLPALDSNDGFASR